MADEHLEGPSHPKYLKLFDSTCGLERQDPLSTLTTDNTEISESVFYYLVTQSYKFIYIVNSDITARNGTLISYKNHVNLQTFPSERNNDREIV